VLIVRTSWLKIPLDRQSPDLGVQLLDFPFAGVIGIYPDPGVERARRVVQQLLLPGVDLVRVNLIATARSATVACSRSVSKAIFAFSAASIFRLDFFIICSVYHDGADAAPIKPLVPKSGSTSDGKAIAKRSETRLRALKPRWTAL
jgi:hypothetical protein